MSRRRAILADLITTETWQTITAPGSGSTSQTFPISHQTDKGSIVYIVSSGTSGHNPACVATCSSVNFNTSQLPSSVRNLRAMIDSGGTSRIPSITVTPTEIKISSTIIFAQDITYTLHYADFEMAE